MTTIFLILGCILFTILFMLVCTAEDKKPIYHFDEKEVKNREKEIQKFLKNKTKFRTKTEMNEEVINEWIVKNKDKIGKL